MQYKALLATEGVTVEFPMDGLEEVAAFAQQLKEDGRYTGTMSLKDTVQLARSARGDDPFGLRAEFVQLVELAQSLER